MNQDDFMKLARKPMEDQTILPVHITISKAWMLVSALQLAVRHPELSDLMKRELEGIARQFQGAITQLYPEAEAAIEMGWYSEFDDLDDHADEVFFSGKSVFDDDWGEDDGLDYLDDDDKGY